jgi:NTE family protein
MGKFGISLSGGGYRATAFHIGTLSALNKLGILKKVDVLSTISGGSILGACFCLSNKPFEEFEQEMKQQLTEKSILTYIAKSYRTIPAYMLALCIIGVLLVLPFTEYAWASVFLLIGIIIIIVKYQFRLFPVSQIIEEAYDHYFFQGAKLADLVNKPQLVIGSTNIQTFRQFTFSKIKMGDSTYSYAKEPILFKHQQFPVSRAVMASTCVPFAFTPVRIDKEFYLQPADQEKINPMLIDGGVYDNQGIHRLTQKGTYECDIIITSDAGNKLPFNGAYNNVFVLLLRTMDVFMMRIKNFQMMQNLYRNSASANKEVGYFSLGWDLDAFVPGYINNLKSGNIMASNIAAHGIPSEWVADVDTYQKDIQTLLEKNIDFPSIKAAGLNDEDLVVARNVGTNLTRLSKHEVDCLSRHAACMTELQVKLYCRSLLVSL